MSKTQLSRRRLRRKVTMVTLKVKTKLTIVFHCLQAESKSVGVGGRVTVSFMIDMQTVNFKT